MSSINFFFELRHICWKEVDASRESHLYCNIPRPTESAILRLRSWINRDSFCSINSRSLKRKISVLICRYLAI